MNKTVVTVLLVILLGIRFLGLGFIVVAGNSSFSPALLLLALYLAALVLLFVRPKWSGLTAMAAGVIDGIIAITMTSGATAMGALVVDVILVVLGLLKFQADPKSKK